MAARKKWYTIWDANTDDLLVIGPRSECAAYLGVKPDSIRQADMYERRGRSGKYSFLSEYLTEEEWRAMELSRFDSVRCPLSGVMVVDPRCTALHDGCRRCGFNPVVNRIRRGQLRSLARQGRLRELGKPPAEETE